MHHAALTGYVRETTLGVLSFQGGRAVGAGGDAVGHVPSLLPTPAVTVATTRMHVTKSSHVSCCIRHTHCDCRPPVATVAATGIYPRVATITDPPVALKCATSSSPCLLHPRHLPVQHRSVDVNTHTYITSHSLRICRDVAVETCNTSTSPPESCDILFSPLRLTSVLATDTAVPGYLTHDTAVPGCTTHDTAGRPVQLAVSGECDWMLAFAVVAAAPRGMLWVTRPPTGRQVCGGEPNVWGQGSGRELKVAMHV